MRNGCCIEDPVATKHMLLTPTACNHAAGEAKADGAGGAAAEQPAAQPKPAAVGAAAQGEGSKPAKRTPMRGAGSKKSPASAAKSSGGDSSKSGGAGGKGGGSQAGKPAAKRKAKQVIDDDSDWEVKEEDKVGLPGGAKGHADMQRGMTGSKPQHEEDA